MGLGYPSLHRVPVGRVGWSAAPPNTVDSFMTKQPTLNPKNSSTPPYTTAAPKPQEQPAQNRRFTTPNHFTI